MNHSPEIVIYGAGAIGGTLGGWISPHYGRVSLLARGEHAAAMKSYGLNLHSPKDKKLPYSIPVSVIDDLAQKPEADIVVLAVKNYDLEQAAIDIKAKLTREPLIVAAQNGVENQDILPRYFSNIIYSVICFSAWLEKPGTVCYLPGGAIVLGTPHSPDEQLRYSIQTVRNIFNLGIKTEITDHFQDAMHCKLVMNLMNGLFSLTGVHVQNISSMRTLKKLMVGTLLEGIEIVQKAGYREVKLPRMPSWKTLRILGMLPNFVFRMFIRNMLPDSTSQDIHDRKKTISEIDTLNGYIVNIADSLGIAAPYNRTIYRLAQTGFSNDAFKPLDVKVLWQNIQKESS